AEIWLENAEFMRGLEAKLKAYELSEPQAQDWLELGFEFAQYGRFERALYALDKVENLLHHSVRTRAADQLFADARLIRANVLLEQGRAEEAIAALRGLEKRAGEHPAAQRGLAEAAL